MSDSQNLQGIPFIRKTTKTIKNGQRKKGFDQPAWLPGTNLGRDDECCLSGGAAAPPLP